MRFALKVADSESMFLSAYYEKSGDTFWTITASDACSYNSFNQARTILSKIRRPLEIVPVAF
nr:hypothetical protein [uncultured Mediterranean phage uvMED]